uniref:Uncharacterized protein n=1 Tax=Arundo donax TaxID=35708 RepID=A0A0A9D5W9_ARUDO
MNILWYFVPVASFINFQCIYLHYVTELLNPERLPLSFLQLYSLLTIIIIMIYLGFLKNYDMSANILSKL